MRIQSINNLQNYQTNNQTSRNVAFNGSVHRSVYEYIESLNPNTPQDLAKKSEIIKKLKAFMAPLHKDTTFLIKSDPILTSYLLPFPKGKVNIGYSYTGVDEHKTLFYNTKTKTSFSLSEPFSYVINNDEKFPLPPELSWSPILDNISYFKSHIDEVIKFFSEDKGFDPDNILYNHMFVQRPWYEDFLPNRIVKKLIQRDKKLAPQFQTLHTNNDVYVFHHELRF